MTLMASNRDKYLKKHAMHLQHTCCVTANNQPTVVVLVFAGLFRFGFDEKLTFESNLFFVICSQR